MKQVSQVDRGMQVIYANHHWVAAACENDEVFVANSLMSSGDISPLVAQQLKQLYAHRLDQDGKLEVCLVRCMQQPNLDDCGVYATAFVFEWATNTVKTDIDVQFDKANMRQHLIDCLECGEVRPFPKMRTHRPRKVAVRKIRKLVV